MGKIKRKKQAAIVIDAEGQRMVVLEKQQNDYGDAASVLAVPENAYDENSSIEDYSFEDLYQFQGGDFQVVDTTNEVFSSKKSSKKSIKRKPMSRIKKRALDYSEEREGYNETEKPSDTPTDYSSSSNDEEERRNNIRMRATEEFAEDPNIDDMVLDEAIEKAEESAVQETAYPKEEEIYEHVKFFLNKTDEDTSRRYASALGREILTCPKCSSMKLGRMANPNYLTCNNGHRMRLHLDYAGKKTAEGVNQGLEQMEAEIETSFSNDLAQDLDESTKLGLNSLIYETSDRPFYMLGAIDGYLGSNDFYRMALSQDERMEHEDGKRYGEQFSNE